MLALIAGRDDLPKRVVASLVDAPLVCAYEGTPPEGVTVDLTFRLETLGGLLVKLGEAGVTRVCFAGAIDRPVLDPDKLDAETRPLVPLFLQALQKGDDGALRVVQDLFERTGFTVLGAHEIAPDILVQGGVFSEAWPDGQMRKNAETGAAYIAAMAPLDIGQACVVADGRVIAMEDAQGTDRLILDAPKAADAILFKGPKPGQNLRIDMPTIGPDTLRAAHAAGLAGVVVDAQDVIMLYPDECAKLSREYGLVLWARTGE